MKVRQHDEASGVLAGDLQLNLPLHRDVIDGRGAVEDVEPGRRIEIEKVRALKVAPHEGEPVDGPEHQGAEPGARRRGIAKMNQSQGTRSVHRPDSSRRAKRSGSLAFLMALCAPLMSYLTRRNWKVLSSTSQIP